MAKTKLLTLEDLYQFCIDKSISNFKADTEDASIIVSIPATYSASHLFEDEDDRFMKIHLKACHTLRNLNRSAISNEAMEKYMDTFHNCPILASVVETENEDGEKTYDFNGHDMEVIEDPFNQGEQRINYIERVVGIIPSDAALSLKEEKKSKKQYLHVDGLIYTVHGNLAADILRNRKTVSCSVEIAVEELSFDAKEKVMNIEAFKFLGVSLLGENVHPGMEGSNASINYSYDHSEELIQIIQELKKSLDNYTLGATQASLEEGGKSVTKLEELLSKYNITIDDITFDYDGLSDDELVALFAENFEAADATDNSEGSTTEDHVDENFTDNTSDVNTNDTTSTDGDTQAEYSSTENGEDTNSVSAEKIRKCYLNEEGNMVFELSFDDIHFALNQLCGIYRNDSEWCYVRTVYEDYFIMNDWDSDKIWKQSYEKDGDNISLTGERIQMFAMLLTESEKIELENMRKNYAELQSFKNDTEANQVRVQKEEILNNEKYSILKDVKAFDELKTNMDTYSVEELEKEVKVIFADHITEIGTYSATPEKVKPAKINFAMTKVKPAKNSFLDGLLKQSNTN